MLLGAAAAHTYVLDTFEPKNWAKLYMAYLMEPEQEVGPLGKGTITFSQCADDAHVWTFDEAGSTYSPNPFGRGNTLTVHLVGSETSPITVSEYDVDVYLGSTKISSETMPGGSYSSSWSMDIEQKISIFTPPGTYTINALGVGSVTNGPANGSVLCGSGTFQL